MPADLSWILILVMLGAMYLFMIRPQQKKMRERQAEIDAMQPGDRVMLTSGIFATIRHLADTQAIVELAPEVEVTIVKQAIARTATADEEEFEFTDEVDEDEEPTTPDSPEEETTEVAGQEAVEPSAETTQTEKN